MTSKRNKANNEITYFYFDAENKLVQVDKYNSTPTLISSVSYAYDGFGRRVKKSVNGVVMFYVYDNEDIRFETDGVGAIIAEYTHGPGIDEPLAMRRSGSNYYYHSNGLGSITALTNSTKAVVQSYVYDSFGQIISQTGSITNPYTFTGREYDPETGLYYYRARYDDARVGRFISEDPIGLAGGINLYSYVHSNPVNFVDPWGLLTSEEWNRLLNEIKGWVRTPYNKLGKKSKKGVGADCSGSVYGIYNNAGFPTDYYMAKDFPLNPNFELVEDGVPQPGDVAVWKGHLAIYDPNAQYGGKKGNVC